MESIRELYRIGRGPSSSHTMGPERAAAMLKERFPQADSFKVVLYGSLAKTGKGHLTDMIIAKALQPQPVEIIFDRKTVLDGHPSTMDMQAFYQNKELVCWRVESVGGGKIIIKGESSTAVAQIYPLASFAEIKAYCREERIGFSEYVERVEGADIWLFLDEIWQAMKNSVYAGLAAEGVLAGGLNVIRKARFLYNQKHIDESPETRECRIVCAYAFAVSEENAAGGTIVTAPTCGACGVLPAVLLYMQEKRRFHDEDIIRALAVAGLIGNLIKTNASISGAECGCQAEIGSACSMASAALAGLFGMDLDQIEYAAEVA
ncbi:MAG: L-serine ammonia-lyase, iron-sulfur-dependent, subunit alpha, partial [Clostridiales bacterium]